MKLFKIILILFVFTSVSTSLYARLDSIGTETIQGKRYILHKVEKSEGLYGIARKYKTTVAEIQEANELNSTILDLGQILKVPAKSLPNANTSAINKKENTSNKSSQIVQNPKVSAKQTITHTVKRGETLYMLSRKYDISVSEIVELNNLKKNSLTLGQKLKIPKKGTVIDNPDLIEDEKEGDANVEKKSGMADVKMSVKDNKLLGSTDYNESGMASWVEDKTIDSKKSIALHKTAPVGTIIRVTNLMNNKSIYVKVIGKLPDTGDNENMVLVLSKAAANMLGAIEQKFRVNLNYSIPK